MKIAFVLFSYFPYGGLQRDFLNILNSCKHKAAQITVLTMSWQGTKPEGVEIIVYPAKGFFSTAQRKHFAQFVQEKVAAEECTTVIGFNKIPGLNYYYAADSCFKEKAINQRGFLYRLTARCRQYLEFEQAVFGSQSTTIAFLISPQQHSQFVKHYQSSDKRIIQLPPGINRDRKANHDSTKIRNEFRKEYSIKEDDILILQIGSGFSIKGVDRSLRAIASLPKSILQRTKYFLVGEDKAKPYLKLAKNLGIKNNLTTFPGQDDIPRFLQGADILLHPAYLESAGLILLEAIVAGLPVLTTASCGYAFHVEKAKSGLICSSPFKQDELNALLYAMLTSSKQEEWKNNGIEYGNSEDLYDMAERVAEYICENKNVGLTVNG